MQKCGNIARHSPDEVYVRCLPTSSSMFVCTCELRCVVVRACIALIAKKSDLCGMTNSQSILAVCLLFFRTAYVGIYCAIYMRRQSRIHCVYLLVTCFERRTTGKEGILCRYISLSWMRGVSHDCNIIYICFAPNANYSITQSRCRIGACTSKILIFIVYLYWFYYENGNISFNWRCFVLNILTD